MLKCRVMLFFHKNILLISTLLCLYSCSKNINIVDVGDGFSRNSINTVKFRNQAITTHKKHQFISYYDDESFLVLAKRKLNTSKWENHKTQFKGNTKDAHNSISIAIDGNGFLHVSWDHHNTKLRYAKSLEPLSLELGEELVMIGSLEDKVTYPEFYNLPNGNLLFFYRSGESGRGNLVVNTYSLSTKKWTQLHDNLIDGENERNAYTQTFVDKRGVIHISWVWRETWDVETNHDLCYARSKDGGLTWEKSTGEKYSLPITLNTAEYAWKIPQKSNLINQTSMTIDDNGNPFIVNYWNDDLEIPQFQFVYLDNGVWKLKNTGFRESKFYLGGGGTKSIPISRPSIFVESLKDDRLVFVLFRDEERENKISLAYTSLRNNLWKVIDLTEETYGKWEPNYDVSLWNSKKQLHIFLQNVNQIDSEGSTNSKPTKVKVLEVKKINQITN
ncbi:BNR repeat-containing protein [Flaviramulus sp. BrNp1-15]|uniref:BNR repeat-containing protein n=1 Tax=Flaviramulus sp. BrNp1-15 TaxID=2916754 RepID=UPI001EE7A9FB|nr:BNR repeat-containing protein [Flaviramulus sp. BrNp1-15]ULC58729.1 BNR repeat-containing protein [Flaviramulus sp. BrNp1-15]